MTLIDKIRAQHRDEIHNIWMVLVEQQRLVIEELTNRIAKAGSDAFKEAAEIAWEDRESAITVKGKLLTRAAEVENGL